MLLCICILFVEVIVMDVVQSECVPDNSLRVEDKEMRLHGRVYLRCDINNVCQNSQSSIFYKCDTKGANCQKIFEFIMANDSVSFFGGTNRSIWTQYHKNNFFGIVLKNSQAVDDGIWKIYITSLGSNYECVNINVITYVRPKEISIIPFNILTSRKFNLTCLVNEIRPVYPLFLVINGFEFRTGVQIDTPNGDTWNISYSVELVLSPNHLSTTRCVIGYDDDWSLYDYWVYSDNLVITPVKDNHLTFHPSEEAVLGCAINTNFAFIGWTQNNISVSESTVFIETRSSEVKGIFDFTNEDTTPALYSELRFNLPSLDQGCDAINEYSGLYECEAINTELGSSFKPVSRHVVVEYAPTFESIRASTYDVSAGPGANIMIVCPLCSNPQVEEYTWFKQNIQLADDRTLMIPYVTKSGFGQYKCVATNRIGSTDFTVNVVNTVDGIIELYQANVNEEVTMDCPLCVTNAKECYWEIDDQQLSIGRFYTIISLKETDYGEYLCTAVFAIGRTWMRIALVNPGNTTIGSPTEEATTEGEPDRRTRVSDHQEEHLFTTGVIAGFAVIGVVVVGMVVPITVLSCMLVRRKQSRDNVNDVLSTNATTSEETSNHYEKIHISYGNNPVYENAPPRQAPNHI